MGRFPPQPTCPEQNEPGLGLDIGSVYLPRFRGPAVLAIARDRVAHVVGGAVVVRFPPSQLQLAPRFSVEELAARWGVSIEQLDELVTKRFFSPSAEARRAVRHRQVRPISPRRDAS